MDAERIRGELGIVTLSFDNLISTNDYAKELNSCLPVIITADTQASGRGRQGHEFFSPYGGVYFSYAFRSSKKDLQMLTVKAGVAVCRALEKVCGIKPCIKWVNDIIYCDKKICGILCENTADLIVVGVGINCSEELFPSALNDIAGKITVENKESLLIEIIKGLNSDLSGEALIKEYSSRSYLTGKTIQFSKDGKILVGRAIGFSSNGSLIAETSSEIVTLFSGEVSVKTI